MLATIAVLGFLGALLYAAYHDATTYRIPNWLSVAIVADFLFAAAVAPLDMTAVGWHLSAGAALLVAGAGLFAAGVLGGGDAKLLAASGTWFGWGALAPYLIVVALLGGALAVAILMLRRTPLPDSLSDKAWINRLHSPDEGVPYGVSIALAGCVMAGKLPLAGVALAGVPGL